MGIFDGKKNSWMIVLHKYHCSSHGFKYELLCDASKKEADAYAAVKALEWEGRHIPKVTGIAIELPDVVQIVKQEN